MAQFFPPLQGMEGGVAAHFIFLRQYLLQRKKDSWVWILFSYIKYQISTCACYFTARIEQQLCQPEELHETLPKHKSIDADGLRHEGKCNWVATDMQRLPSWCIPLTSPQTHSRALRYLPRDEWKSHFMIHFKLDWTDHYEMSCRAEKCVQKGIVKLPLKTFCVYAKDTRDSLQENPQVN